MAAPIKFTRPVSKDSKTQPTIKIDFRGKHQGTYFELRRIAKTDFDVKQTTLCRLILEDFIKEHKLNPMNTRGKRIIQMAMGFGEGKNKKED